MISDWRRAWGQGPFPFLFVQLANFGGQAALGLFAQPSPQASTWAAVREGQAMALALPNTGMVVSLDIGDAADIHPKNKQEVGRRLSLLARSLAHGETIVASGPIYRGLIVEGEKIRVLFSQIGRGLARSEGGIKGFVIAGRDRKWVEADARVEGDNVVVWSKQVPGPVAVRYAWADNPAASLFSQEGLPAAPFRTDDWSE
jgi:sialate O-acetylesterase